MSQSGSRTNVSVVASSMAEGTSGGSANHSIDATMTPVGLGAAKVRLEIASFDPCLVHQGAASYPDKVRTVIERTRGFPFFRVVKVRSSGVPQCDCPKVETKRSVHEWYEVPGQSPTFSVPNFSPFAAFGGVQLFTKQWAQFTQMYLFANLSSAVSSSSVNNTAGSGQTIAATNAIGTIQIVGGTGGTSAAFADFKLQSQSASTSGAVSAAMTAISSNAYTLTGTITNSSGSSIAYNEVGIYFTANSQVFCVCHDAPLSGGPFNVSNSGTLAVTYSHTWT